MVHQVGLTPGTKPGRGPNRTTIVDLSPYSRPDRRPVRARSSRTTTGQHAQRKPLNVLQWNAEGVPKAQHESLLGHSGPHQLTVWKALLASNRWRTDKPAEYYNRPKSSNG
jgi:hypothetical protein